MVTYGLWACIPEVQLAGSNPAGLIKITTTNPFVPGGIIFYFVKAQNDR